MDFKAPSNFMILNIPVSFVLGSKLSDILTIRYKYTSLTKMPSYKARFHYVPKLGGREEKKNSI